MRERFIYWWLARRAGIESGHMLAIVMRARRAEASQLDILHLCDCVAPLYMKGRHD